MSGGGRSLSRPKDSFELDLDRLDSIEIIKITLQSRQFIAVSILTISLEVGRIGLQIRQVYVALILRFHVIRT